MSGTLQFREMLAGHWGVGGEAAVGGTVYRDYLQSIKYPRSVQMNGSDSSTIITIIVKAIAKPDLAAGPSLRLCQCAGGRGRPESKG